MGNGAAFLARTKKSSDSTQHLGNFFESGVASKIRHFGTLELLFDVLNLVCVRYFDHFTVWQIGTSMTVTQGD